MRKALAYFGVFAVTVIYIVTMRLVGRLIVNNDGFWGSLAGWTGYPLFHYLAGRVRYAYRPVSPKVPA